MNIFVVKNIELIGNERKLTQTEQKTGDISNSIIVNTNMNGNGNTIHHTMSAETITNYQKIIKNQQNQIENQQEQISKLISIINKLSDKAS